MRSPSLFFLSAAVSLAACAHMGRDHGPTTKKERGPNPYYNLVVSNLKAFEGDTQGSLESLLKAIEAYPEEPYLKYLAAERYVQAQNLGEAEKFLDQALKLKPKWYAAESLKAEILESKGDLKKAGEIFETLFKEGPKKEEACFQLVQSLVHRQKYNQAASVLNAWLAKNPESTTALYFLATIQNNYLNHSDEAIKIYTKLLQLEPDDTRAHSQMAQIYLKQKNNKKALEEFQAIERQYPNDLSIKLQIASLYQEQGSIEGAIQKLNEVLELNPEADRVHYFLGLLYEKTSAHQKALDHFEKVTSASGIFKDAVLQRVAILKDLKEDKKAIQVLEKALQKAPKIPQFYQFLSLLLEDQGRLSDAVDWLKKGLQKAPNNEELYFNLGSLYDKQGKKEESLKIMQKVLEINPKNAQAMNTIGYTYAEAGQNLDEAEKLIRKALELKPGDAYIIDSLGWVYYQKGDLKKSLLYLDKAHKIFPKEPAILEHLGDLYLKMGEKRRAQKFFKEALEFGKKKVKRDEEEIKRVEKKIQ